jgi:signal transduction histidine kinase
VPGARLTRTQGTILLAAACAAGLVLNLALTISTSNGPPDVQTLFALAGEAVGAVLGLWLWQRRPDLRMGLVIVVWTLVSIAGDVTSMIDSPAAATLAWPLVQVVSCVYAAMVLSYPTGYVTDRLDRWFVALAAAVTLGSAVPPMLWSDPRGCDGCRPRTISLIYTGSRDWSGIGRVFAGLLAVSGVAFVALVVRRVLRTRPGARRRQWPVMLAAAVTAIPFVGVWGSVALDRQGPFVDVFDWVNSVAPLIVAAALASGAFATRRARGPVGDLVLALGRSPGGARAALAEALGDPTLELALWLPDRRVWTDEDGTEVAVDAVHPPPGRAVTLVGDGAAALIHDAALADQRSLLQAAGEAVRLSLENHRLHAELRLQLAELRASRARAVRAGDEERRRLERDLHDGAQQRLLGLGIVLELAHSQLQAGDRGAADLLAEAQDELKTALAELRDFARGIHPAILTDQGLAPAVRTLAQRAPVPVELAIPDDRLPAAVETTAYYVIAEALANIARHAAARSGSVSVARRNGVVVVEVRDDGVGGASLAAGTGLRGLADRVAALDGQLGVTSPPGGGTALTAEIPCGS